MLNLKYAVSNADKLRASLSAATHVHFLVEWVDTDTPCTPSSNTTLDRTPTDLNTIATNDICAAPGAGVRNVKQVFGINIDASGTNIVQVIASLAGTEYKRGPAFTLLPGESFTLNDEGVWFHYDANGGVYAVGQTFAVQADMETGTSTSLVVSPGMIKYHPSSVKAWVSCGVAADIQQSYNIASLTDTGTGVVTVTFTTAQSAATYCVIACIETTQISSWSIVNERKVHLRFNTRATGSFALDCTDNTAATVVLKDPNTWHVLVLGDFA